MSIYIYINKSNTFQYIFLLFLYLTQKKCRIFFVVKTISPVCFCLESLTDPKNEARIDSRGEISEFPQLVCSFLNSIWTSPTPGTTTAPGGYSEDGFATRGRGPRSHPRLGLDTFRLNRSSLSEMYGSVTLRATRRIEGTQTHQLDPKHQFIKHLLTWSFQPTKTWGFWIHKWG